MANNSYICIPEVNAHKNYGPRRECRCLDDFKQQIMAYYNGMDEDYYDDDAVSVKPQKSLRKTLIYAIVAIFVGICIAVAL